MKLRLWPTRSIQSTTNGKKERQALDDAIGSTKRHNVFLRWRWMAAAKKMLRRGQCHSGWRCDDDKTRNKKSQVSIISKNLWEIMTIKNGMSNMEHGQSRNTKKKHEQDAGTRLGTSHLPAIETRAKCQIVADIMASSKR